VAWAAGARGLLAQESDEGGDVEPASLCDHLDPAVVGVPSVADQSQLQGTSPGPPAKAHPLDPAAHPCGDPDDLVTDRRCTRNVIAGFVAAGGLIHESTLARRGVMGPTMQIQLCPCRKDPT